MGFIFDFKRYHTPQLTQSEI